MDRGRPGRTRGARVKLAAGALGALVLLAGCTGEENSAEPPAAGPATSSTTAVAPTVVPQTSVRKITGKIRQAEREQLAAEVGDIAAADALTLHLLSRQPLFANARAEAA